ncbi:cathepsin B-like [Brevipalpus obovatus]|uniref:cathepsin B-like n=1 Tax=Brevipalpus obovatus TaxID=246614 RepID=UPI003D9F4730
MNLKLSIAHHPSNLSYKNSTHGSSSVCILSIEMKLLIILLASISLALAKPSLHPLSDEMIEHINSLNLSWKAGRNFHPSQLDYVKSLLGPVHDGSHDVAPKKVQVSIPILDSFDAREAWPNCPSIGLIRDQGGCASGSIFAAVEAMSDRLCIDSAGHRKWNISAEDVVGCCTDCGGCEGGFNFNAWMYWTTFGIVTGDSYQGGGCKPYSIAPCEHYVSGPRPKCENQKTPQCTKQCQPGYPISYKGDKIFGTEPWAIYGSVTDIQAEIIEFGPVEAYIDVYDDFPNYKSGVYVRSSDNLLGQHSVKLLGWGTENGVDYWLAANSWNTDWGDNGFFKVRRGTNECRIEFQIISAVLM